MPAWVVPAFIGGAVVSLFFSSRLVRSLESLGEYFAMPELLLGLVVAAAADGPELTSAIAAMVQGKRTEGVGVLLGSNVFNIAALLGLGSLAAGWVALHRRVVLLEGAVAVGVAGPAVAFVSGALGPLAASLITLGFFLPYLALSALPAGRLPLPSAARAWLAQALREEESELAGGLEQAGALELARGREEVGTQEHVGTQEGVARRHLGPLVARAGTALVLVVAASALMEHAATRGGSALGVPQVVVGGVVLAAVTSLPNAVAAIYLARAGRGSALMAEAMNSNSFNVVGGLVVPALAGGLVLGHAGAGTGLTAGAYIVMTLVALVLAGSGKGLGRPAGAALVSLYLAYLVGLIVIG